MGAFENQCREMSKELLIDLLRKTLEDKSKLRAGIKALIVSAESTEADSEDEHAGCICNASEKLYTLLEGRLDY